MAKRRGKIKSSVGDTLAKRIEAGETVNGLVGFITMDYNDDEIFVPVVLEGIKTGPDNCGLSILASIPNGTESIAITPCQFIEPEGLDAYKAKKQKIKEIAKVEERVSKKYSARGQRDEFFRWLEENGSLAAKEEVSAELAELKKTPKNLALHELKDVMRLALATLYDIQPDEFSLSLSNGRY